MGRFTVITNCTLLTLPAAVAAPCGVCCCRETELQDYQRHGAFNVDSGRPRRQFAGPETQAMLMDTWDGFSVIQNPSQSLPQGGGPTPEVKTVHLKSEGHCYQGRVGGTGDWLPGAQEWIRVLERTRGGLSNGTDRAWVQQEVRQRRQVFERQMVQLRQQQQQAQKKPGKKGK